MPWEMGSLGKMRRETNGDKRRRKRKKETDKRDKVYKTKKRQKCRQDHNIWK